MSSEPLEPTETTKHLETPTPADTTREDLAVPPESKTPGGATPSILGVAAIATFCSIVVMTAGMVGYKQFFEKYTRIAVVNVGEIMEAKQVQLASMVTGKSATDQDRGAAYDMASHFGADLQAAFKAVQVECDCVLLTSGAVVSGESVDLTAQVKQKIGLAGLDIDAMKKKLAESMRIVPKAPAAK